MYCYWEAWCWKVYEAYKIMQLWFQIAFREAHRLAGEVVTLSEKQNVAMSSLSLEQLQSIR
jgi:argininosuccinate lyase